LGSQSSQAHIANFSEPYEKRIESTVGFLGNFNDKADLLCTTAVGFTLVLSISGIQYPL